MNRDAPDDKKYVPVFGSGRVFIVPERKMYEFKEVNWADLSEEEARIQIDILAEEYVTSHIKNVDYISWSVVKEHWDWKVSFEVGITAKDEKIIVDVNTTYFHLRGEHPEYTVTERVVLSLECARETILRRIAEEVFRARPYTSLGKIPEWHEAHSSSG